MSEYDERPERKAVLLERELRWSKQEVTREEMLAAFKSRKRRINLKINRDRGRLATLRALP